MSVQEAAAHEEPPPHAQPTSPSPPAPNSYLDEVQEGFRQLKALFAAVDAGQLSAEDPATWESVRGKPGVVLDPMPWQQLVSLVSQGGERALGQLGRHPLGIKSYWDHRENVILPHYESVTHYLMIDIFGLPAEVAQDGRKRAGVPPGFFLAPPSTAAGTGILGDGGSGSQAKPKTCGGGDRAASEAERGGSKVADGGAGQTAEQGSFRLVTKWRDNDFPYHLQPGVSHLNLWANRPLAEEEVEACIAARVPANCQRCWFVNTPSLQSVPALWHAHVMVMQEGEGQQKEQQQHRGSG